MNCFERRIRLFKNMAIIGCILLPIFIAIAIFTGIEDENSVLFILPMMLSIFGMFPIIFGFTFSYTYKIQYRTAQTLFTDREIQDIDRPLYLQIAIAEKAKRLMTEGKQKNDMSEYNEFRELVMMTKPMGVTYGRYGGGYGGF